MVRRFHVEVVLKLDVQFSCPVEISRFEIIGVFVLFWFGFVGDLKWTILYIRREGKINRSKDRRLRKHGKVFIQGAEIFRLLFLVVETFN